MNAAVETKRFAVGDAFRWEGKVFRVIGVEAEGYVCVPGPSRSTAKLDPKTGAYKAADAVSFLFEDFNDVENEEKLTHYLVMTLSPGYWGRGKTVAEAIKNSEWICSGDKVRLIRCDEHARVNDVGQFLYNAKQHLGVGVVAGDKQSVTKLQWEAGVSP